MRPPMKSLVKKKGPENGADSLFLRNLLFSSISSRCVALKVPAFTVPRALGFVFLWKMRRVF